MAVARWGRAHWEGGEGQDDLGWKRPDVGRGKGNEGGEGTEEMGKGGRGMQVVVLLSMINGNAGTAYINMKLLH